MHNRLEDSYIDPRMVTIPRGLCMVLLFIILLPPFFALLTLYLTYEWFKTNKFFRRLILFFLFGLVSGWVYPMIHDTSDWRYMTYWFNDPYYVRNAWLCGLWFSGVCGLLSMGCYIIYNQLTGKE